MIELKNFIDLTPGERTMILTWRNDIRIRLFMYTDELISAESHEKFINSLHQSNDKRYFVVYKNGAPIGVIDLVDITDTTASLGLYANPFSDRKGIGRIILRALIRYAYETLSLSTLKIEYFEGNEKARYLYDKFNFRETEKIQKDDKTIICMELHREHQ